MVLLATERDQLGPTEIACHERRRRGRTCPAAPGGSARADESELASDEPGRIREPTPATSSRLRGTSRGWPWDDSWCQSCYEASGRQGESTVTTTWSEIDPGRDQRSRRTGGLPPEPAAGLPRLRGHPGSARGSRGVRRWRRRCRATCRP